MSLPFFGVEELLPPPTPSMTPQAASETADTEAARAMAVRRTAVLRVVRAFTSGAFRAREQHCDPGG
ncbi:hypothetical protein GCM10022207_44000 [Streptomyces lannensis]|uniref:Uncharacterized protein n=1 Tax=Streptomyces lannensis TaxID=766498 RepID=A0ABP7KD50_9ACTN